MLSYMDVVIIELGISRHDWFYYFIKFARNSWFQSDEMLNIVAASIFSSFAYFIPS